MSSQSVGAPQDNGCFGFYVIQEWLPNGYGLATITPCVGDGSMQDVMFIVIFRKLRDPLPAYDGIYRIIGQDLQGSFSIMRMNDGDSDEYINVQWLIDMTPTSMPVDAQRWRANGCIVCLDKSSVCMCARVSVF